jgi:ABC-2 type transport system permease protein
MAALEIVRRDLVRYLRNPVRTAMLFSMPLAMAAIFAVVFGGNSVEKISIKVLVFDEDDSLLSKLTQSAGSSPEADDRLELVKVGPEGYEMMDNGEASALVHIPDGFSMDLLRGEPVTIEVVKNPSQRFLPQAVEEGAGFGAVVLSQASRVFRPELSTISGLYESEGFPADQVIGTLSIAFNSKLRELEDILNPPLIELQTSEVSEEEEEQESGGNNIGAILSYILPGFAIMGVFFLAQSATRDILLDRESGRLRHLLSAPLSPTQYLLGKCISVLVVTTAGFVILVGVGMVAGVSWGDPLAASALVLAAAIGASGTLLLIMSLVGSERQGDALSTIIIIAWCMLGGAFFPISEMPAIVHRLAGSTLVYWATSGFNTLIQDGGGLRDIVLNLLVMTGIGITFLVAGAWFLGRRIERGQA